MAPKWPRVPISQVACAVIGGTPSRNAPEYWRGDVPWATAKDIAGVSGRYLEHVEEYITQEGLRNSAAKLLPKSTVVITARGTVGAVAQLGREMAFNQTCYALLPKSGLDNDFLFYALKGTLMEMRVLTYGTVFETITIRTFDHWLIPLPPLPEQRAIARILGTLDDKIELNRRMNETLEQMARAIFKSWFVDFDPVIDNALGAGNPIPNVFAEKAARRRELLARAKSEGRETCFPKHIAALFPDRFVDSELGPIPAGWEAGRFRDVAQQVRDQENPMLSPDVLFYHFSIPAYDEGQNPKHDYGKNIKSLKLRVPPEAILLSKLNPEIERVWLVDIPPVQRAVCSTEFLVFNPRAPFTRSYVYCLSRSALFRQQIEGLVTGTSKSHQRAQVDSILNIAVVLPPLPLVAAFDRVAESLFARTLECRQESRTLAALRDSLLPKLISGEIRMRDTESFLREREL